MVEKNNEKPCHLGSHGHTNNRHNKNHVRPKVIKSATHFQSIAMPINGKHRKLEEDISNQENWHKSPSTAVLGVSPNVSRQGSPNYSKPRQSPSKEGSPRTSPSLGGFYAGAKFSEPPSPAALPKPPTRWTGGIFMATGGSFPITSSERADNITGQLKMLLNVSA